MIPKDWHYRELMSEAMADAQRRLGGITQAELARRLNVSREGLLYSKTQTPLQGEEMPRRGFGLAKSIQLAELAGWGAARINELALAWVQEAFFRSGRDHFETIEMLPEADRVKRWRELTRNAMAKGDL